MNKQNDHSLLRQFLGWKKQLQKQLLDILVEESQRMRLMARPVSEVIAA